MKVSFFSVNVHMNVHTNMFFLRHKRYSFLSYIFLLIIMCLYDMYNYVVDKIKDYFGVKIALYFAYLGHYTLALCMPAFVGLGIWITQWQADQVSAGVLSPQESYSSFL